MARALEQVGCPWEHSPFILIPVFTERHGVRAVEALNMPDYLGQDAPQPIPNRNYASPIILGGLYVEHIVDPAVSHSTLKDIEGGQFAGLFNPQAALYQELKNGPVPKGTAFHRPSVLNQIRRQQMGTMMQNQTAE